MSSIDLSSEALTRLKTLAQKATPGPWETFYPVTRSPIDDILYITSEERRIDGLFDVAQIHNTSPNQPEQKVGKYICEQRANAAFIAAAHPGVLLAMCEEIARLRAQVATQEVLSGEDDACMTQLEVERDALEEQVARLEKEADWLAREVSSWEHDQLDGTGKHIREVPELREAARKAVEGAA